MRRGTRTLSPRSTPKRTLTSRRAHIQKAWVRVKVAQMSTQDRLKELGRAMAKEINQQINRKGFTRRFLERIKDPK